MKGTLCIAAGLLVAGNAMANIAVVNTDSAIITSGTFSYDYTMSSADNVLVVATYKDSGGGRYQNFSFDGNAATGSLENGRRTSMFYYFGTGDSVMTLASVTDTSVNNSIMLIWELSGVNKSAGVVSGSATDLNPGSLQLTTTDANTFVIEAGGWNPGNINSTTDATMAPDANNGTIGSVDFDALNSPLPGGGFLGGGSGNIASGAGTYDLGWTVSQFDTANGDAPIGLVSDFSDLAYGFVAVPEPATLGLVGVFGAGVLFIRRRLLM